MKPPRPDRYGDPDHPTYPGKGYAICGAKTRKANRFGDFVCVRKPAEGRTRCKLHGGASPRGADHPSFKTGERSIVTQALPARMRDAYEQSLKDPRLLDLKSNVAILNARMLDLLGRVDQGGGTTFLDVQKSFDQLVSAIRQEDKRGQSAALTDLDQLIRKGVGDYVAWQEITRVQDDIRKHIETQQRLETAGDRAVPIAEVMALMGMILNLVQVNVGNAEEKKRIADGIQRALGSRGAALQ